MKRALRLAVLAVLMPLAVQAQDHSNPCDKSQGKPKFCDQALAISLLEFKGIEQNGNVVLSWSAIEDGEHSHYLIQRSNDAVNFTTVGETRSKGFTDKPVASSYYRLVDVDNKGVQTFHRIIFVKVEHSPVSYKVYKLNGEYLNTFASYSDIPKNMPLIINGVKTAIK